MDNVFSHEKNVGNLRWNKGNLEQLWAVNYITPDGNRFDVEYEWRQIPVHAPPDEGKNN